jgi:hypothetical protein
MVAESFEGLPPHPTLRATFSHKGRREAVDGDETT